VSAQGGGELINNGNFSAGVNAWTLDHINGAQGSLNIESTNDGKMAAHIAVAEAAAEPYYVQLFQGKLNIKSGQTYHLHFRARSNAGVSISANLMLAQAPWTNLWNKEVALAPQWQDFSFDVTPARSADNARVTFSRLAAQASEYWFTDVSLTTPK